MHSKLVHRRDNPAYSKLFSGNKLISPGTKRENWKMVDKKITKDHRANAVSETAFTGKQLQNSIATRKQIFRTIKQRLRINNLVM